LSLVVFSNLAKICQKQGSLYSNVPRRTVKTTNSREKLKRLDRWLRTAFSYTRSVLAICILPVLCADLLLFLRMRKGAEFATGPWPIFLRSEWTAFVGLLAKIAHLDVTRVAGGLAIFVAGIRYLVAILSALLSGKPVAIPSVTDCFNGLLIR
jgi:hypothetical protein